MHKRHMISILGALTAISSLAFGWDPINSPYGKPGCPPYNSPETQGSNGTPSNESSTSGGKTSDPINLATGDYQLVEVDLHIPGRGMDFEIRRFYRSLSGTQSVMRFVEDTTIDLIGFAPDTSMGDHWYMNYDIRLSLSEPTYSGILVDPNPEAIVDPTQVEATENLPDFISVLDGTGRLAAYSKYEEIPDQTDLYSSVGSYSNTSFARKLVFTHADEPVYLFESDMTVYEFFPAWETTLLNHNTGASTNNELPYAGRLKSITDRNGNQIQFNWETSNGVERIGAAVDTLFHTINFVYHDESHNGQSSSLASDDRASTLLWKVIDHAGREVEYDYLSRSHSVVMSSATLPAIENTNQFSLPAEHERFSSGRVWSYEYDDGNSQFWDGRMLEKITSPNGDVVLENDYNWSYGEQEEPNTLRVLRQKYGQSEYNYLLTDLDGEYLDLSNNLDMSEDYYVWVNDRRGAITRLKYHGNNTSTPGFYRQLLEETVYEGLVDDPKKSTWATMDSNGNPIAWFYIDDSNDYAHYDVPISHNGPGGVASPVAYTHTYVTNDNWNVTGAQSPMYSRGGIGGIIDSASFEVEDSTSAPNNPLKWGAKISHTQSAGNSSAVIIETWDYSRFDFGGCGCGGLGFETGHKDGNGNYTLKEYDTGVNLTTGRPTGDLLAVYHDLSTGDFDTSYAAAEGYAAAVERFEYNDWGQITKHIHPKKTVLDDNAIEIDHHQVDQFVYYPFNAHPNNAGRLKQRIVDDLDDNPSTLSNSQMTTTYEYDAIGNVIKEIHPDGDISEYLYNQAAELVQEVHYDQNGVSGKPYAQTDYFYDANDNLVRKEVANLDMNRDAVVGNSTITTVLEYDIHNIPTTESREAELFDGVIQEYAGVGRKAEAPVSISAFVSTEWTYDAADNLEFQYDGLAVNGTDLNNVTKYEYNSRDRLTKKTVGVGDTNPFVVSFDYDEKGQAKSLTVDPDNNTQSEQYSIIYDGFDRITSYSDPMGNEFNYEYDNNGNLVKQYVCGPLDIDTSTAVDSANALYSQSMEYDRHDRMIKQSVEIYDYDYASGTGPACNTLPSGSTQQVTELTYNNDSSLRTLKELSGEAGMFNYSDFFYDTASRLKIVMDGDGNEVLNEYDDESNLVNATYTDLSTDIGAPFEVFEMVFEYDALDRRVATVDGKSNRSESAFDSRSNVVLRTDARGNTTNLTYDGMSRLTNTSVDMRDTGDGTGVVVSTIDTVTRYDDANRVYEEEDNNGNVTKYEYDGLNRITKLTMPDGKFYSTTYDDNGNIETHTDARGVLIRNTYDHNNRLITRALEGTSIVGSTFENYMYDGLGRLREVTNDLTKITREYDSRSNLVREVQNADAFNLFPPGSDRVVAYSHDDANNLDQISYPSGRVINRVFDKLNRLVSIQDSMMTNPVTEFKYIGNRLQQRINGNGTLTGYEYDGHNGASDHVDDHGFGHVSKITTTNVATSTILDSFTFRWDKSQNKNNYTDAGSGMKNRRERSFDYDSSDRLVSVDADFPDLSTDYTSPTNSGVTDYSLDGVHNRLAVSGFEEAGSPIGVYKDTTVDMPDHVKNNQYTYSPREGGGQWVYAYDENGNMILKAEYNVSDFTGDYELNFFDYSAFLSAYSNEEASADLNNDGTWNFFDLSAFLADFTTDTSLDNQHYFYDFRNQLVKVDFKSGNTVYHTVTNTYDSLARRLVEATSDGVVMLEKQMVYGCVSQWEVIEQIQLAEGVNPEKLVTSHVYGLGIDDEIAYRLEDFAIPENFWAHRDDQNSLTSITDINGVVKERYEYGDFGKVVVIDPGTGDVRAAGTSFGAVHLYTGRSLISGTGLYDYRFRVMDLETGRFNQRDPLGYFDSMNMYGYVVNNPYAFVDPYGLFSLSDAWEITKAFNDGAKEGWMGVWDGIIPFADPFKDNGFYDPCDKTLAISRGMGQVARDALLTAAGVGGIQALKTGGKPLAEVAIRSKDNVFRVLVRWGKKKGAGFRIDRAHHGKPWGHMHLWKF